MSKDFAPIEKRYGKPKSLKMSFPLNSKEFKNLKDSMKDGRDSDVTLFIFKHKKVIVIAKPWYGEGLYRAPSGGWKPDESLEEVALREGYEETGTKIKLQRYILRIEVIFSHSRKKVIWTSHIFTAGYLSGKLQPIDKKEIKEVKLLTLAELSSLKPHLLKTGSGGLAYRAVLTEKALEEIKKCRGDLYDRPPEGTSPSPPKTTSKYKRAGTEFSPHFLNLSIVNRMLSAI
jgi:8-oxo-dGTP pyrophosphatase MutT (NUDIX family)